MFCFVFFSTEERISLENYFPVDSSLSAPFPSQLLVRNLAGLVQIFWAHILYWLALIFVSFWNLILLTVAFYCKLPQFSIEMCIIMKEYMTEWCIERINDYMSRPMILLFLLVSTKKSSFLFISAKWGILTSIFNRSLQISKQSLF